MHVLLGLYSSFFFAYLQVGSSKQNQQNQYYAFIFIETKKCHDRKTFG